MTSRKVVVTGGAGFIGSHLVDSLIERGDEVTVIDNFRTGKIEFVHKSANLIDLDLKNISTIEGIFEGVDEVYHLAANADVQKGWDNPKRDLELNLVNTLSLANICANQRVGNFIFASTGSVYGEAKVIPTPETYSIIQQTSLYGASKYSAENFLGAYAHAGKFNVTIFRFVSVLGTRYTHGHIFDFVQRLKQDPTELKVLGNGFQNKSYMHVSDCVRGVIGLRGANQFEIFNLGRPDSIVIRESIKIIAESLKLTPNISYGDGPSGWVGDNPLILLEVEKAKQGGWVPNTTISSAIEETVGWLVENNWVFERVKSDIE
jgi:UDP-glucose 4-epimerase